MIEYSLFIPEITHCDVSLRFSASKRLVSVLLSHSKTHPKRAELPKPCADTTASQPEDSPARHGDLHFGGRDAPTDRVEVTDRRRGLHLVHNVSLHACSSSPSRVSPSGPGEPTMKSRSAEGRRTGADTVQTNLLSAVHWTGNSMESLMGGYSTEAIDLTKVGSHARTHQRQLHCFPCSE